MKALKWINDMQAGVANGVEISTLALSNMQVLVAAYLVPHREA